MTRKNLTLQRFSSQLLYPLASTIIGHRPFSRFIRSKRAISRRERERKKGKNIPDNCDDNGKNDRWKRDPEVVDVLTPIQTDARWKFSTSFASFDRARIARLFLHRRPTSPPKIAGFLSWTVRQVQVTHFDRDSPRVAFERFRKITEKEFDRCPSIVLQTNFKFSARKSSLIRFRRIWKNWKSFHKKKKKKIETTSKEK